MRITVFLCLFGVIQVLAVPSMGQGKLNLKMKNSTLEKVLQNIEENSGYRFFYQSEDLAGKSLVDVNVKDKTVFEVLDRVLPGLELNYEVFDKYIAIRSVSKRKIKDSLSQQQKSVSGKVSDENGEPLPGVTVLIIGTSNGTITNADGEFNISGLTSKSVLQFSFVGMRTQEIEVGSQTNIDVVLLADAIGLEEVVAVGYGIQKKSDLTGAISSVSAEDFEKQPVFRVEEALQGRASGVQVIKNSGAPGSDIKIRIRGSNSINGNNQPLVVVDGVLGADLRSLNTNDIASMEILKDASATAIYGSRGANGVILVTTKRGADKQLITVDVFGSASSLSKTIDILSPQEFADINNLSVIDGGTDYQKEYFRTGYTKNAQVSVSGKKNNIGYFISGNFIDQSGTSINSEYRRYSLRSNFDTKLTDKLSVQLNLYGSNEALLNLVRGGRSSSPDDRAGVVGILGWDPTLPVIDEDGNYNLLSSNGSGLINPIAQRLESDANTSVNTLNSNINISYDITDNLNLTVLGGLVYRNALSENYYGIPAGTVMGEPFGSGSSTYSTTLQNSNILTWTKLIDQHNLKLTGVFEVQKFVSKSLGTGSGEYSIPANYYNIELGTNPSVRADYSESQINSWMGRAEYNFDRKLFLTGTLRADISSKFRSGNQLGIFPSGTVAYQFLNLLNEKIDRLKFRIGYGETGNQGVSPYITYNTLSTGQNYPLNGTTETRGITTPKNVANPDLTWETTKQTNIGLDATIFKGKVNLELNKYWKNTTDLLLNVPIPNFVGGGSVTRNVGEVFNGGWEFNVDVNLINSGNFSWNMNTNYSYNKNEVIKLAGDQTELLLSPLGGISNTAGAYVLLREGMPMSQFYGATFMGTYKTGDAGGTPGYARYKMDGDNKVDLDVIGNGAPKHTWSLTNNITWRNFDMSFLIRGVQGFDIMNFTRAKISLGGGVQSLPTLGEYRNRWTPDNETDIPYGGDLFINSTRYIEKGDFIKLSNVAIGYNIKQNNVFESVRVYLSAQNLFTITQYSGYDPEASSVAASVGSAASIDYGANPNSRTITLGLNMKF